MPKCALILRLSSLSRMDYLDHSASIYILHSISMHCVHLFHFSCTLHNGLLHDINIFARCLASLKKLETIFNLVTKLLTKLGSWGLTETINARGNRAFVGQIP